MIKKSVLMLAGSAIFCSGVILFPLPVPLGLPTMIIGLAIMLKASNTVKRAVIRISNKHPFSRQVWQKYKYFRRSKKSRI